MPVYGSDGAQLSMKQLIGQFEHVINQSQSPASPVGILGTDKRDNWYKAYTKMCKGISKLCSSEICKTKSKTKCNEYCITIFTLHI